MPLLYQSGYVTIKDYDESFNSYTLGISNNEVRIGQTKTTLFLFELKLNKSAEAAMKQIDLKDYRSKFANCRLPIVKVGVNFDSEKRTIGEWKV